MRKPLLVLALLCFYTWVSAQVVNDTANWTDGSWTLSGTFNATALLANPESDGNFSYNDDAAGSGSTDILNAESPTIDISGAIGAAETIVRVAFDYNYNLGSEFDLEYFDADANAWVAWEAIPDNSGTTSSWCANVVGSFNSTDLDVSGFSITQATGFRYRLAYDASAVFGWGFCVNPPTLVSAGTDALDFNNLQFPATATVELGMGVDVFAQAFESGLTDVTAGQAPGINAWIGVSTTNTDPATWAETDWTPATFNVEVGNNDEYTLNIGSTLGEGEYYYASRFSLNGGPFTYGGFDTGGGDGTWDGGPDVSGVLNVVCPTETPDYLENFASFVPQCWLEATSGDPATGGPTDFGTGNWIADGFGNVGTTGAARINIFSNNTSDWLISPFIDLSAGGYEVVFDIALTAFANTNTGTFGSDDQIQFLVSTDGATWTTLQTWDASTPISNTGESVIIDISTLTSSSAEFAFWASDGATNDPEDVDFFVDNFQVRTPPACPEPTGLNATNIMLDSAELAWTAGGTETVWDLELVDITAGGTATGTPTATGVSNPYMATSLASGNDYEFYVRSDCGGSTSIWSGPFAFSTPVLGQTCETALTATVEVDCAAATPISFDTNTAPDIGPIGACDTFGVNNGFWYEFVAPAVGGVVINYVSGASLEYAVFDACGGNEILCNGTPTTGGSEDLNGLTPGNSYYIALWNDSFNLGPQEVCIQEGAACPAPTVLSAGNFTTTSAELSWNEEGTATLWDVELVDITAGGTATGTPTASGVTNPYVQMGLVEGNDYEFYVRADCGGDVSDWAGPFAFTVIVPPVNDECDNATSLTVNADDSCAATTPGTILGATASGIDETTCGGTEDDDVWFTFVATGTTHTIELQNVTGSTTDLYHSVWEGDCTGTLGLLNLLCSDPNTSSISGLTPGTTYYLRVYSWTATPGQTTSFDVCIGTPPAPPANDECADAIALTVNADDSCTATTPGTVASATASGIDEATCGGTEDDDVWFSFVATGSTHTIDLLNVAGSTTDLYHSLWEGDCVAGLTNLLCSDPNSSVASGLTAGTTYYLRVYSWTATTGQNSTFDVCIGTPPAPPANDECADAIALAVNADDSCAATTSGTITSATASGIDEAACGGTEDDDVWFSFVAADVEHTIDLLNVAGSTTDLYHSLWEGDCTAGLTNLLCSDPNSSTATGLTIGNTYYLRVYSWTATAGQSVDFDVCIGSVPSAPANDNCADATMLTVDAGFCDGTVTNGSTTSSTVETPTDEGSCWGGSANDGDVWFTFVAPPSGVVTVSTDFTGGTLTDTQLAVYEGACGAFTEIGCSEDEGTVVNFNSIIPDLTVTPGDTYYVQVSGYNSNVGTFCVEVSSQPGIAPGTTDVCEALPAVDISAANGNNNEFVDILDAAGNIVAQINANGNDLGVVNGELFVASAATRTFGTGFYSSRNVTLTPTNQPSSNVTVRLYHLQAEIDALLAADPGSAIGDINFVKNEQACGPVFTMQGETVFQTTNDAYGTGAYIEISISGFSSFFSSTQTNILPVELTEFTGEVNGLVNELSWSTATEEHTEVFVVERSANGFGGWTAIGEVAAVGNSTTTQRYAFTDNAPLAANYYRLRIVDFDGSTEFSSVVFLEQGDAAELRVWPNPARDLLSIAGARNAEVEIIDIKGRVVLTHNDAQNIDISGLPSGVYFVRVEGKMLKFIKQ